MNVCPVGVQGELYIGGKGVALGYHNDEEKTRAAFINHLKLGYLYKTGDYGVFHKEGYIEFLGRKDQQVKIKGYRIELGEIENQLLSNKSVKQVVVTVDQEDDSSKFICAYVVLNDKLTSLELRNYLKMKLPEYMIPSYFIELEKIPLTPNGKVDRKALPNYKKSINVKTQYIPPQNEIEEKVSNIWKDILSLDEISIHDNFFELGGDSLKVTKIVDRVYKEFNVKIPLRNLFDDPTVAKLAELIQQKNSQKSTMEKILQEIEGLSDEEIQEVLLEEIQ